MISPLSDLYLYFLLLTLPCLVKYVFFYNSKLSAGTPCLVLEIGCGVGNALCLMGEAFPNSNFIGLDIDNESIELARKNAQSKNLTNIKVMGMDDCIFPTLTPLILSLG